jgi:hypothetical protein
MGGKIRENILVLLEAEMWLTITITSTISVSVWHLGFLILAARPRHAARPLSLSVLFLRISLLQVLEFVVLLQGNRDPLSWQCG